VNTRGYEKDGNKRGGSELVDVAQKGYTVKKLEREGGLCNRPAKATRKGAKALIIKKKLEKGGGGSGTKKKKISKRRKETGDSGTLAEQTNPAAWCP